MLSQLHKCLGLHLFLALVISYVLLLVLLQHPARNLLVVEGEWAPAARAVAVVVDDFHVCVVLPGRRLHFQWYLIQILVDLPRLDQLCCTVLADGMLAAVDVL